MKEREVVMPKFGRRSMRVLDTAHQDLQALAHLAIPLMDFTVTDGFRDREAQNSAFHAGLSEKMWGESVHNERPSLGIHFTPWPVAWYNLKRFYHLAGIVRAKAHDLSIIVRWGGDWDGDFDLDDQKFMDLAHYELIIRT